MHFRATLPGIPLLEEFSKGKEPELPVSIPVSFVLYLNTTKNVV